MKNIVREDKRRKLDRKITGNISEDRIWEQWYSKEAMESKLPKMNQKDFLFESNKDYQDQILINNRGLKKFSVREFEQYVNLFAAAFSAYNFDVGTIICTIGLTTPEMIAIKYAATSRGLINSNLNFMDADNYVNETSILYDRIRFLKPKIIFYLDILEDKINNILNEKEFEDIIKVKMPLEKSTPFISKEKAAITLLNLKNYLTGKTVNNKMNLSEFLYLGKNVELPESVYSSKLPCNISFTSGTTGLNKGVLLSHDAFNALAFQHQIGNFGFERGEKHLALIPPFLAFWDADTVHVVQSFGGENILELKLAYDKIQEYLPKYLPQIGIWPQSMWDAVLRLPEEELKKVAENLKEVIIGGERCEINQAKQFYENTGITQMAGYGATEVSTTFSVAHQYCNKVGTAGIPLPFNNVKIIKADGTEATYGEAGRLYISSPCLMNGYFNNEEATKQVLKKDKNGVIWYDTKDYAVIDDDGCLTVLDRYQEPIIVNYNGSESEVQLLDIAEIIKLNEYVKICKLCSFNGKIVLHLMLNNYCETPNDVMLESIIQSIKNTVDERFWPDYINILDELPRTAVGKVNYKLINEEAMEIINNINSEEKLYVINAKEDEIKKVKK